ncbi:hypothetical protein [uncultured Fibrella sp.]|uniref:hypothetical protein n=1 Tax=uncultured Fibrella sp. TaxID=1284596 RepID=UPI0035CBBD23
MMMSTRYQVAISWFIITCSLACSPEKKTEQNNADSTVSFDKVAAESAAVLNQLHNAAREINSACPVQIDPATRLDSAQVLSEAALQFNYTLITASRDDIDLQQLEVTTKPALIESVKTNSAMNDLRDHSITMVYNYRDRNGEYLLKIPVTPTDYAR